MLWVGVAVAKYSILLEGVFQLRQKSAGLPQKNPEFCKT
jgi:hypothetical protein